MQRPFPLIEVYKGLCGDAGLGVLNPTAYYSNGLRRVLAAEMKHMTFIDTVFHFRGGLRAAVCGERYRLRTDWLYSWAAEINPMTAAEIKHSGEPPHGITAEINLSLII